METTTWILGNNNQPGLMVEDGIRLRLLCFPQAGSGAWVYQEWEKMCPKGVQVRGIFVKEELKRDNTNKKKYFLSLSLSLSLCLSVCLFSFFLSLLGAMRVSTDNPFIDKNDLLSNKYTRVSSLSLSLLY